MTDQQFSSGTEMLREVVAAWEETIAIRPTHNLVIARSFAGKTLDLLKSFAAAQAVPEPVYWRWRNGGSENWVYDCLRPTNVNLDRLEIQPLYVSPVPSTPDAAAQAPRKELLGMLDYLENAARVKTTGFVAPEVKIHNMHIENFAAGIREALSLPSTTRATGPLVPWELDCQRAVCAAPECECPALPSTVRP